MGGVLQRSLILNFKIDAIHYLTYLFICSFCEPVVFFCFNWSRFANNTLIML